MGKKSNLNMNHARKNHKSPVKRSLQLKKDSQVALRNSLKYADENNNSIESSPAVKSSKHKTSIQPSIQSSKSSFNGRR